MKWSVKSGLSKASDIIEFFRLPVLPSCSYEDTSTMKMSAEPSETFPFLSRNLALRFCYLWKVHFEVVTLGCNSSTRSMLKSLFQNGLPQYEGIFVFILTISDI